MGDEFIVHLVDGASKNRFSGLQQKRDNSMFYKVFRTIKWAIFFSLASVLPGQALAIGLGEIQLNSPLNEPLDAEVQLFQAGDLDEGEILVSIAPKADFEAAGVDRLFFLTSLKFSLELDNPKGPLIHIRTDAPVREPYLNFLLEVQWPSGRLLREYTLLMELPAFSENGTTAPRAIKGTEVPAVKQPVSKPAPLDISALEAELAAVEVATMEAAPVVTPVVPTAVAPVAESAAPEANKLSEEQVSAEQPVPVPESEVLLAPVPEVISSEPASVGITAGSAPAAAEYPGTVPIYSTVGGVSDHSIQPGDNLWSIAIKYRQSADCTSREYVCADGVTVQQAMLAIQRINPEAFIKGNINLLKKGKVLRMPSYDSVTDMTSREAVAEISRQNIEWSGNADGRKTAPAMEQIDATRQEAEVATAAPADIEEGHLKLSVPGAAETNGSARAGGADTTKLESLQNELAIGMEELDRTKREKGEIKGQMSSLDEQAETMKQMLEVRSAELAALQAALAKKGQTEESVPAPEVEMTEPVAETPVVDEQAPVADEPAVEEAAVEEIPSESSPSFLMDNLLIILAALGTVVVAVVVALVLRKRKSAAPKRSEAIEEDMPSMDEAPEEMASMEEEELSSDTSDESMDGMDSFDLDEAAAPVEAKPETDDAIGEADIYISFGTYEKAESLLKSAIASEPKRTDLRLKLLEVYTGMGNLKAFDKQLEELSALRDAGANERAREMRNKISGAAAVDAPKDSGFSGELDLDLSLDTFAEEAPQESADLDFDLNLDLDEPKKPQGAFATSMSQAPTVQQPAISLSEMKTAVSPAVKVSEARTESREMLDLDLDLDTDLTSTKSREAVKPALDTEPAAIQETSGADSSVDDEFDFLADADESSTKLDLARAYIDMGDKEGARDILQEVLEEGQDAQRQEAKKLLDSIG